MVLNNSGPLSIGGSVAGQSINLELDRNATDSSQLNESDLRLLAEKPSGSISLLDFYGKANYWISLLTSSSSLSILTRGCRVNSSREVFLGAWLDFPPQVDPDIGFIKLDGKGIFSLARRVSGDGFNDRCYALALDSTSNVFVVGSSNSTGTAGGVDGYVACFNSGGTIQWQKTLGSSYNDTFLDIEVFNNSDIYVAGWSAEAAGNADILLVKYNTSGVVQWQKRLRGTGSDYGSNVTVDSAGNPYVLAVTSTSGQVAGGQDMVIAKYNSSGVVQWQRRLGAASTEGNYFPFGMSTDAANNVYIAFDTDTSGQTAGGYDSIVAKYNSSGVLQWQKRLGGGGTGPVADDFPQCLHVTSAGDVYVGGYAGFKSLIYKRDTNGALLWQRTLAYKDSFDQRVTGIWVHSPTAFYATGFAQEPATSVYKAWAARLSTAGNRTGVNGDWTYSASTLTDAATTLTDAATTLTEVTATATQASVSYSVSSVADLSSAKQLL